MVLAAVQRHPLGYFAGNEGKGTLNSSCTTARIRTQERPLDSSLGPPPPRIQRKNMARQKADQTPLQVVTSQGVRHRFLRGMITHDLMLRGLDFDHAYAVARSIRGRLEGREEVTTSEILDLIQEELETVFGDTLPSNLKDPVKIAAELYVLRNDQRQPFSRGLLARSLAGAGLDLDRSYQLVNQFRTELKQEGTTVLSSQEIATRLEDLLERVEGADTARRYRLVRRIQHLPRPLVVYLGGASGTGKSTLALELAHLLGLYRVTSTDTVRQLMRMVFSTSILPALHTSSFEAVAPIGAAVAEGVGDVSGEQDVTSRVMATFEEQSARVCVGVRAVVERAIVENRSILVEGVHLYPPLIPFADLEGEAYQVPLILSCVDREAHRARFLSRARMSSRGADRYLENFSSIRFLHEFILQEVESHDIPIVDSSISDPPVGRVLRVFTDFLQHRVPYLTEAGPVRPGIPTLLLIIDGVADRPVRALGGRTPLEAAETPTLDRLAREGQCGLADPVAPGVVPDTAAGSLALFGQSPLAMKRGPVEALGVGIELLPGDIALRGNFACLDERGRVLDRRAGRIREEAEELAAAIDRMTLPQSLFDEVEVRVKSSTEHRLAIVLRGENLSSAIVGSDPGDGAEGSLPLTPRPSDSDDEKAVHTARILSIFEEKARRRLAKHSVNRKRTAQGLPPANGLLTRGAGRVHRLIPLEESGIPLRLSCISGDGTVLGLAGWLGAHNITSPAMTANLDTDLGVKFKLALESLEQDDLVILHVKGADIAAHDRRPELKVAFLEKLDAHLKELLKAHEDPLRIAVASDHATLSESGQHVADPLPVLIWGEGLEADEVEAFNEKSVPGGSLRRFPLQLLLGRLFNLQ